MYFFFFSGGIFLRYCIVSMFERAVVLTTCDGYMRLHSQQWASDQVGRFKKSSSTKTHFQASGFLRCFLSLFFFGTCFPIKIVGGRLEARSSKSRTLGRSRVQLWVTWVQFPPMLPPEMLDEATDISKLGNWCQHFFFWVWGVWLELGWLVLLLMSGALWGCLLVRTSDLSGKRQSRLDGTKA